MSDKLFLKRFFSSALSCSFAFALFVSLAPLAYADSPSIITYQGRLKVNNQPFSGSKLISIFLCDSLIGPTCVNTGDQSVTVSTGLFKSTFTVPSGVDLSVGSWYVELKVEADVLSPREQLTSVPYALYSSSAIYSVTAGTAAYAGALAVSAGTGVIASTHVYLVDGSSLTVAGAVSAAAFYGNGSGLTGVTGASGTDATKVLKTGDTMTGQLTLVGSTLTVGGDALSVGSKFLVSSVGVTGIGDISGITLDTNTAVHAVAVLSGGDPGGRIAVFGDARAAGVTSADVLLGANFEATVAGNNALNYFIGARAKVRRESTASGTIDRAIGLMVDNITNDSGAGALTNTYGIYIGTQTAGTQTNAPYALYAEDLNARTFFAGRVGISSSSPQYQFVVSSGAGETGTIMAVSTGVSNMFWVAGDGAHATKYYGDGSGLTGVTGASGTDSTKVLKTGDTMSGRLTAPDYTATYGVTAASASFTYGIKAGTGVYTAVGADQYSVTASSGITALLFNLGHNITLSSTTASAVGGGLTVSTNVYILGFSSAARYYGDGSSLTGVTASQIPATGVQAGLLGASVIASSIAVGSIYDSAIVTGISASKLSGALPAISGAALTNLPGDGLGSHVATTTLNMANFGIMNVASMTVTNGITLSSITASGEVSALRYQINGSTVLALSGTESLGVGYQAGRINAGNSNSFMGYMAGYNNTTGGYNTILGASAGQANVTGSNNSFIGYEAGFYNDIGSNNSAVGYMSGLWNRTGSANAILGSYAGFGVTPNSFSSSTLVGFKSGYGLTTGSNNIFLGWQAGDSVTSGSGNIVLGYNADVSAPTISNELNIGGVLYGDLSARTIGISTRVPQAALDVVSTGTANPMVMAQIWRDSGGVIKASMSATGVMMASHFVGSSLTLSGTGVFNSTVTMTEGMLQYGAGTAGQVLKSGGNGFVFWGVDDTAGSFNTPYRLQMVNGAGNGYQDSVLIQNAATNITVMASSLTVNGDFNATGPATFNSVYATSLDLSGASPQIQSPAGTMNFNAAAGGNFVIQGNGIERMRVKNAGQVGIGTDAPVSQLDVFGGSITIRGSQAALVFEDSQRVISSEAASAYGAGIRVSTNVYIVGFASATKYYGDGSGLTGVVSADATKVLKTGDAMTGPLTLSGSSLTVTGDISAARYQINGSTVLAISVPQSGISLGRGAGDVDTAYGGTFVGDTAGHSNTTGAMNSFMGTGAGYFNTIGEGNAFFGSNTGGYNTTGSNNTFAGAFAGFQHITGGDNTFVGYQAGSRNQTGSANVVLGKDAGNGQIGQSFSSSTIVGYMAGYSLSDGGNDNILLGFRAGRNITTGNRNIIIGYDIGTFNQTDSYTLNIGSAIYGDLLSGAIAIGYPENLPKYRLVVSSGAGESGPLLVISTGGVIVTTMTGAGEVIARKFYGDGSGLTGVGGTDSTKVLKAGDTMSGALSVDNAAYFGAPDTKSTFTALGSMFLASNSSITLSGASAQIYLPNVPVLSNDAANKAYVDSKVASAGPWARVDAINTVKLSTAVDNVGVGIAVPWAKLHVASAAVNNNEDLFMVSTGTVDNSQIVFGISAAGNAGAEVGLKGNLVIGLAYAEAGSAPANGMIVEGGVLIGTSTVDANTAMKVVGADASGEYVIKFYSGAKLVGGMRQK